MKPRSTMMTPAEPSSDVTMKDLASSPRYPLLFVNPKTCDHCLQTTHDHEKDVDQQPRKPRYLWWMKTTRHSDGKIHPSGTICGICMEVKDRNYVKGTTNQMLAELRKDPTEDERFLRLRKKRAQGLPDDPSDRPNLKNTVKSTDTVSSAAKVGGYFYPLADFVRTRQLNNFKDMDELVKYINTTMGFKTGWGENKKMVSSCRTSRSARRIISRILSRTRKRKSSPRRMGMSRRPGASFKTSFRTSTLRTRPGNRQGPWTWSPWRTRRSTTTTTTPCRELV